MRLPQRTAQTAKSNVKPVVPTPERVQTARHSWAQNAGPVQPEVAQILHAGDTETTQADADLASELIASGATTQSVDAVIAVLSSHRDGASINAAARTSAINYRTAQRIVEAASARRQFLAAS
jgi:hypothetical protein